MQPLTLSAQRSHSSASLALFALLAVATALAPLMYGGALYGLPILLPLALTARRRGVIVQVVALALAAYFCFAAGWYVAWLVPGGYPKPSAQSILLVRVVLASLVTAAFVVTFRSGRRHTDTGA